MGNIQLFKRLVLELELVKILLFLSILLMSMEIRLLSSMEYLNSTMMSRSISQSIHSWAMNSGLKRHVLVYQMEELAVLHLSSL